MYTWLKFFHVLGMVLYVGGFLALTRLMGHAVNNATAESREDAYRVYKRMHKFVDWIGLAIMVTTGVWLLVSDPMAKAYMKQGYFHMKLTGVLVVVVCDVFLSMKLFKLTGDGPQPKPAFFKMLHGIAALGFLGALAAIYIIRG